MRNAMAVAAPLLVFGAYVLARSLARRPISRFALNVQSSVLLLAYFAITASLGVFWVANQQLPVFDLHYLFGYGTVLLVALHLFFNFRVILRHFRGGARTREAGPERKVARAAWPALGGLAIAGVAFGLGMRHGRTELRMTWDAPARRAAHASRGAGPLDVVEQYHLASSHSRAGLLMRAPSVDWGASPPAAFKSYPGSERVALSGAPALPSSRPLSAAIQGPHEARRSDRLTLASLATILFHGAGITAERGGLALRAAPSSGALFATELYVAAHSVDGLAPGVYHYDPSGHALVRVPEGDAREVFPNVDGARVAAAVVMTSIFRRTGHKYRDRAYRYVTADAGHLLENVRIAAHEVGFVAAPMRDYDDARVTRSISVDNVEEGIMAVVPLGAAPAPAPAAANAAGQFEYLPAPGGDHALGVTAIVHAATSLRAVGASPDASRDGAIALPEPESSSEPALSTIANRRSQRSFTKEPISPSELGSMLHHAASIPPLLSAAVRVHVVASRVAGLEPGSYAYDARAHALRARRSGDLSREAQSAGLEQEALGRAAAVFVLTFDRATLRAEGARAYRQAFLEAGMIGERLVLEAAARRLGACPVGAFYDREAAALVGVEMEREWVVHFAAVGHVPGLPH